MRYCIINKVDRLARNRLDDAIIHSTLRGANITLVSVTENIDESPSGMLMHGILASMAEFYSLNLAQEVLKGMTQKASIGGTPTKAPVGYLNVRTTDAKGREARIERDYSANGLSDEEAQRVSQVLHQVFTQLEASSDDERAVLTAQRDKLEAERLKLVQAHYADAIPLDLLKVEQDRIRTSLDAITNRLDSLATTYHNAHEGLDQIVGVLTDLGDLSSKCEPAERRILNCALFKRIIVDEDEQVTFVPAEPAAAVLAQEHRGETPQPAPDAKLPRHQAGQVSNFSTYVDLRGLEPLTPCMPCRCATSCATGPSCLRMFPKSPESGPSASLQRS